MIDRICPNCGVTIYNREPLEKDALMKCGKCGFSSLWHELNKTEQDEPGISAVSRLGEELKEALVDAKNKLLATDDPKAHPVHPGKILNENFIKPSSHNLKSLSDQLGLPFPYMEQLVKGRLPITALISRKLVRHFGQDEGFWIGMQEIYDRYQRMGSHEDKNKQVYPKSPMLRYEAEVEKARIEREKSKLVQSQLEKSTKEYLDSSDDEIIKMSDEIGIERQWIDHLISGKLPFNDTISRVIGKYFNQSDSFWMNIQHHYCHINDNIKNFILDELNDEPEKDMISQWKKTVVESGGRMATEDELKSAGVGSKFEDWYDEEFTDEEQSAPDHINPTHYKDQYPIEVKEMIRSILEHTDLNSFEAYCLGNELKYRLRAGFKDPETIEQDIKKALWYNAERRVEG